MAKILRKLSVLSDSVLFEGQQSQEVDAAATRCSRSNSLQETTIEFRRGYEVLGDGDHPVGRSESWSRALKRFTVREGRRVLARQNAMPRWGR